MSLFYRKFCGKPYKLSSFLSKNLLFTFVETMAKVERGWICLADIPNIEFSEKFVAVFNPKSNDLYWIQQGNDIGALSEVKITCLPF